MVSPYPTPTISTIDLVIAAVALNNGLRIITKHFLSIKEIRKDFMVVIEHGS